MSKRTRDQLTLDDLFSENPIAKKQLTNEDVQHLPLDLLMQTIELDINPKTNSGDLYLIGNNQSFNDILKEFGSQRYSEIEEPENDNLIESDNEIATNDSGLTENLVKNAFDIVEEIKSKEVKEEHCFAPQKGMYSATVDQTQQQLHVHMHHVCNCNMMYPYCVPGYRPAQIMPSPVYPGQPVPRPYNLHHYQYTQFNVSPYNVPVSNAVIGQPSLQPASTADLAFGPPPRDRRNLERQESAEQDVPANVPEKSTTTSDQRSAYAGYIPTNNVYVQTPTPNVQDVIDLTDEPPQGTSSTVGDDYLLQLEQGCISAEKIAIRNQHRPCFKNIQNLCNRTRSEILKPSTTVSNIHSQGIPWATKDFIYAFVRATNCWYILKGYLDNKDGSLGKIDKELSPEFRTCYVEWEKYTKELTRHLIQIFSSLDMNVSNPNPAPPNNMNTGPPPLTHISLIKNRIGLNSKKGADPQSVPSISSNTERNSSTKEVNSLKGVRGILRIPSPGDLAESRNAASESLDATPRGEDSDSESRVYMKPGSYNVPRKQHSLQSTVNSPRSIEFLETAQNVAAYHRKVAAEKPDPLTPDVLGDKAWRSAKDTASHFIRQNEENSLSSIFNVEKRLETIFNVAQQENPIEQWLNNSQFDADVENDEHEKDVAFPPAFSREPGISKPITLLQRTRFSAKGSNTASDLASSLGADQNFGMGIEITSRTYRKRSESTDQKTNMKPFSSTFRRNNNLEYRTGGLTDFAIFAIQNIFQDLERTELALRLAAEPPVLNVTLAGEPKNPTDLDTIQEKIKRRKYNSINEFVHDLRHFIICAYEYYRGTKEITSVELFSDKFEQHLIRDFHYVDFSAVTGEASEVVGSLVLKKEKPKKIPEGDGDH